VALDKELEAERQADEARSPHVAPGLRLPDDGGIILLDNSDPPQLIELQQSSGELNRTEGQYLRATSSRRQDQADHRAARLHAKIQRTSPCPRFTSI